MIMSKVLPDYGYLPVLLLYYTVRLAVKTLLDISDNDKKDKGPVETQQD